MRNYIIFYYQDNKFIAEIHKQGNSKIISDSEDIKELIKIASKYGHNIKGETKLTDNIFSITRHFEEYLKDKKNPIKLIGNILPNMVLNKSNKILGKTLVASTLAAVIASSGLSFTNDANYASANTTNDLYYAELVDKEIDDENKEEEIIEEDNTETQEMDNMLQNDEFHFSYEDRTDTENINNALRYEDLFEEYANMYGLDKNLLMALAAQESSGEHYESLDSGPAEGIMQIEKEVHIDSEVSAYNVITGEIDTIYITPDNLQNLETNIQIGSMILRNCLEENNYNIPLALQAYNFGPGNMYNVLTTCSELENIDEEELRNNPTNTAWLNYREFLNTGDCQYIEHVFSFLPNNSTITVKDRNNNDISITLYNDYQNINTI